MCSFKLARIVFFFIFLLIFLIPNRISTQIINNVNLLSFFDLSYRSLEPWIGDVWGYSKDGKEYALVASTDGGVIIIDVSNPRNPIEASWIPLPEGANNLFHVRPSNRGYAYAVMRPGPLQIIDIRDPYNAREVSQYSINFSGCYGLFIYEDKDLLILYDTDGSPPGVSLILLDISDPVNPVQLGTYSSQYHHVLVRNDTLYGFLLNDKVELVDISDPANPKQIKLWSTRDKRTHSGWLNDSGTILTTDHEYIGGGVHFWDMTTLPNNPLLLSTYHTPTNNQGDVSVHHTRYYFNLVYMSYWQDGLRVVDVTDPSSPVEVGVYDVVDPNLKGNYFYGAWGIFPYLPSRNVLLSHSKYPAGLFVLDFINDGPGLYHDEIDTVSITEGFAQATFKIVNGTNILAENSHVYYRTNTQPNWQRVSVKSTLIDTVFSFRLPINPYDTYIEYYIQVQDSNGRKTRAPGLAPFNDYYEVVIDKDKSLEVELVFFRTIVIGNAIRLEWRTASEIDNEGFIILRSENEQGKYDLIASYYQYSSLVGLGNSTVGKTYSYIDKNVSINKTYWYKLISVSYNGDTQIFGPIAASLKNNGTLINEFILYPNYPNPFNSSTYINYGVPNLIDLGVVINLNIYDLSGREVKNLFEGIAEPGNHQLVWDGTDNLGREVASGIYLLRLETPMVIKVRKLILLR